jgi:hypothetical protein
MPSIDSPFTMVVLIVLIAVGAGVIEKWLKLRTARAGDAPDKVELDRMRGEIDALTERVRTLEKIATDPDAHLREDFRHLA